jgi:DNA repair exonuclease SbcCD ATPase subunit
MKKEMDEMKDLKAILKEYIKKDKHLNEVNKDLSCLVRKQKKKLDELVNSRRELIEKIGEMKTSNESNLEKRKDHQVAQLENRIAELEQSLLKLQAELTENKQQIAIKNVIIEDNNKAIQEYRNTISELKNKEMERIDTNRKTKQELNEALQTIEELEVHINELNENNSELENKISIGKLKRKTLRDHLQEKIQQMETQEKEFHHQLEQQKILLKDTYRQQLKNIQMILESMKSELALEKEKVEKTKIEMQNAVQDTEKLLKMIEVLKEKNRLKDEQIEAITATLNEQKRQTSILTGKLEKLKNAYQLCVI